MQSTMLNPAPVAREFPPFNLTRLLRTVFAPKAGERVCILIDLDDPREAAGYRFLENPELTIQRHACEVFQRGLQERTLRELGLTGGAMFAYRVTGGSNLDLPDTAWSTDGREVNLAEEVYCKYDLILCIPHILRRLRLPLSQSNTASVARLCTGSIASS
jgi:hypothetical protein